MKVTGAFARCGPDVMLALLLFLICMSAYAYDVGDWPQQQLRDTALRVIDEGATVLEVEGIPLPGAGPVKGVILVRFQLGEYSYGRVLTVFDRDGQEWVSGGWGAGGCDDVALLGVLDMASPGRLELKGGWAPPEPQLPSSVPAKPVLAVITRDRADDGIERMELLLLDISDPERPWQVLRTWAGSRIPVWKPTPEMPPQRSLGSRALSLTLDPTDPGPTLLLTTVDLPTPDSRCREPVPEVQRFLFEGGRFVEQRPAGLHEPCP